MYSWGDDTSTWRGPGSYDYGSARRGYLDTLKDASVAKGSRSYATRTAPDEMVDTLDKTIESESKNPIVIAIDVTGSMADWPQEIFKKLPVLYQTLSKYREDTEISFAAIGDATCDAYPLQVNDFDKGISLDDHIKALCPEGGGGGQHYESYELFGYFLLNHCRTPNATSPFLIIFGDEGFYESVAPAQVAHYIGDRLQGPADSGEMWKALRQKFNIYLLHKPYDDKGLDKEIIGQWKEALGEEKVVPIFEENRAVDVAMAIIARHWGEFEDFEENMSARHTDSQKASVYASLRYVDIADKPGDGKSKLARSKKASKSVSLLGPKDNEEDKEEDA